MNSEKEKSILTLSDIIDNPVKTLKIKGVGIVKIRDPTVKDRLEAKEFLLSLQGYKDMTDMEKGLEEQKLIALKMLVEPKISFEDYKECNEIKILAILDSVAMEYGKKMKILTDKRRREIDTFLSQMKES